MRLSGVALDLDPGGELDARVDAGGEDLEDQVAEAVLPVLDPGVAGAHVQPVFEALLVAEALGRDHHQPMSEVADWRGVLVAEGLLDQVGGPASGRPVDRQGVDHAASSAARSAQTVSDLKLAGP